MILKFFRLIRLPNLLIMAFTMVMLRYFLVLPWLNIQNCALNYDAVHLQFSNLHFALLVLSVVFIGAAGYIINDYFDVRIDKLNRPDTNVIDNGIKRRWAIVLHTVFNVLGVLLGVWLSWQNHMLTLGLMLFVGAPTLLWFYSIDFKRRALIGNLVIALLSGMVPLLVALFEVPALNRRYAEGLSMGLVNFNPIVEMALVFAIFGFTLSLIREIIKDIEDYEGDMQYGCKTLPIVAGIARAKGVIIALIGVFVLFLAYYEFTRFLADAEADMKSLLWFTLLVQVPMIFLGYKVWKASSKAHYRFASLITKLIMVAGISYLFMFPSILSELCTPTV